MKWLDFKVWQKLATVFGFFILGFIALTIWDYNHLSELSTELRMQLVINHAIFGVFISLIFTGFVFAVSKSFKSTIIAAEKLAQGDLTFTLAASRKDELGLIEESLAKLKNRLREIIDHVKETSINLVAASSELNSGAQLISSGANDQAATSTEISMTMDQIAMISKQATESASETNEIAKNAYEGILKGADDVNKALSVIEDIAQKNSIVSEISYQTKILSINASVEAARAAEFGRGFSVIAEQVKRLAETSQTSAAEIEAVSKSGVQITRNSAKQLSELVAEFHKTADLIQIVADAGAEQYAAIDQINLSMQELNNITQQNASSSEELTASSEELVRLSQSLSQQVAFFKLTKEDLEEDNLYTSNHTDNNEHQVEKDDFSHVVENRFNSNVSFDDNNYLLNNHGGFAEFNGSQNFNRDYEPTFVSNKPFEVVEDEREPLVESKRKKKSKSIENDSNEDGMSDFKQKTSSGIRINLSDNDDLDSKFEKMK